MGRGDDWSAEECILAIWAYTVMDRFRGSVKKKTLYEEVSRLTGRSMKSAEFKIQNVAWCDKGRPWDEKPISSASNTQNLLLELFEKHGKDYRYLDDYHEIATHMANMGEGMPQIAGPETSPKYITEGDPVEIKGFRKTRSSKLRAEARKHYRKLDGELSCHVCGATFDGVLPGIGHGGEIIQIHHLKAISEQEVETMSLDVALSKVAPVCPTCHVLIHSRRPMLPIDEAVALIQTCRQGVRRQIDGK